jgi:3-oxoacid CoA-transferase subunit B
MADEIIALLTPGTTLNLGIGMPTLVADRMPPGLDVMVHSENGVLGVAGYPTRDRVSHTRINASKESIDVIKGASYFDSALSFGMIRGGHIDFCILGGMEVDADGNLANWMVPGKKVTGMGGAMDLVNGAKKVIIMLAHFTKEGEAKLLPKCTLPLTGKSVVHVAITEMGMFEPNRGKFRVVKLAPQVKIADLNMSAAILEPAGHV